MGLKGFYGEVTMEELAQRPSLGLGKGLRVRRKVRGWRERRKGEVRSSEGSRHEEMEGWREGHDGKRNVMT